MKCRVCHQEFEDIYAHLFPKQEGMLTHRDEEHAVVEQAFRKILFEGTCPWCGGKVRTFVFGSDDDPNWEVECQQCHYQWDED